ncbi:TPA: cell surface protein, partial [Streptococcus suis]
MSKQKVVSSLLLSTVVLGGLAFYSTTTVKAESLEPDVTSVNASDATNKPVVSNEEESDFLAEEEEPEESDAPVETLNEEIKDVTEPEALLQPRAMSNSTSSGMEEIPVDDSVSEKIADTPLIQTTNADSTNYKNSGEQEKFKKSVTIDSVKVEKNKLEWQVIFDTSEWSFDYNGGFYFILPKGLKLTSIKGNDGTELISKFPSKVESSNNKDGDSYRYFSKEEDNTSFDNQWGWSAGQAPDDTVNRWKSENQLSKIYFIDKIKSTSQLTYNLTAEMTDSNQKSFPLVVVMKSFRYKNSNRTEVTSLGAREITLVTPKETPMPPKEAPKPEEPLVPKEEPKKEEPQTPPAPEAPKDAPETPEEKPQVPESPTPDAPAPSTPSVPGEKPMESPKPEAPKEDTPA